MSQILLSLPDSSAGTTKAPSSMFSQLSLRTAFGSTVLRCRHILLHILALDISRSRTYAPADVRAPQRCFPPVFCFLATEQKALPDRQLCELVDRYYGGWKQLDAYQTLKQSIR